MHHRRRLTMARLSVAFFGWRVLAADAPAPPVEWLTDIGVMKASKAE